MLRDRADLLNDLYTTGSCTNHPNSLATQLDTFLGPNGGVMAFPFEGLQALEWRDVTLGGKAGAQKEVLRTGSVAIFGGDDPLILFLNKLRCRHAGVEPTVLADMKLRVDEVEVRSEFIPPWKTLGPSPLTPYLLQGILIERNVAINSRTWNCQEGL